MNWYIEVLRKYAVFEGRARRSEYWYFILFNFIIIVMLVFVDMVLGTSSQSTSFSLFADLYSLAVLAPTLAVAVRRFHDIGKSGWWVLVGFVPFVGSLVLLYFMVQDSEPGDNAYGPNPKGVTA